jgi:hypothetical protein
VTGPYAAPTRSADPVATAEDALILLVTGRVDMAKRLLERLPGLIGDALAAAKPVPPTPTQLQLEAAELARVRAHVRALVAETDRLRAQQRQAEADLASRRRELAGLDAAIAKRRRSLERPAERSTEPRSSRPHELLSAALAAGTITAERVAELLRLRPEDVPPIAAGRVGLAGTAWRRLLREIGGS